MYCVDVKLSGSFLESMYKNAKLPSAFSFSTNTPDEVVDNLSSIANSYRFKHKPGRNEIRNMVSCTVKHSHGQADFEYFLPNPYCYSVWAVRLLLAFIWDSDICWMYTHFDVERARKRPYGHPDFLFLGPNAIEPFVVWCRINPERARRIASKFVADLDKRFPGAAIALPPEVLVEMRENLSSLIRDDDGVLALVDVRNNLYLRDVDGSVCGITARYCTYLATPIGWFPVPERFASASTIYSLMRALKISYPRTQSKRAWTDELGMQLTFTLGKPITSAQGEEGLMCPSRFRS